MKRISLFALSLVLSSACGGPEESPVESVSSSLVGVMRYGNCTPNEETKLNAAVQVLVEITGTQYSGPGANYPQYEACLSSATFVENGGWSGAQIASLLRMNTVTGIWCWDLPPTVAAQAWEKQFNNEEVYFNKTYLASWTPRRIAGTIGHELMHNRGFWHSQNDFGSRYYPNTVPEQVEACINNGVPNPMPAPIPRSNNGCTSLARCCEPDPDGGCLVCVPKFQECP